MATSKVTFIRSEYEKLVEQVKLLLWKRYVESTKSKWSLLKIYLPAVLFFVLLRIIYNVFDGIFSGGALEPFFVPLAFWVFMQRFVVHVMHEKSNRLRESMKMMGLSETAYWISYFVSDGIIIGFTLAFISCFFSLGGLFNGANFGTLLGLFFMFCLSVIPYLFFLTAFFDTWEGCVQAFLVINLIFYSLYILMFVVNAVSDNLQGACCLFPPFALQIGSGAFLDSYNGIPMSRICGIMFADIFIFSVLGWYFNQVWPNRYGIPRPPYFIFQKTYWFPNRYPLINHVGTADDSTMVTTNVLAHTISIVEDGLSLAPAENTPEEVVDETVYGLPTVKIRRLVKTIRGTPVVNSLSVKMYANQIFTLLGQNGSGKSTLVNLLTGLFSPDYSRSTSASIYGYKLSTEMSQIRESLGVCPQFDILFDQLTVREHIIFFARLKGFPGPEAEAEANKLTRQFRLENKLHHLGRALSAGQRRRLSVAIALCGGSRFVVLDEPTAGMDPVSRHDLWSTLSTFRTGRTLLVTTQNMTEADVLGDRVGIMSHGTMRCTGTTQFLKKHFGAGYKLLFPACTNGLVTEEHLACLTKFIRVHVPNAVVHYPDTGMDTGNNTGTGMDTGTNTGKVTGKSIAYTLPFTTTAQLGPFFTALEAHAGGLSVRDYEVNVTSLEDVFMKIDDPTGNTTGNTTGTTTGSGNNTISVTGNTNGMTTAGGMSGHGTNMSGVETSPASLQTSSRTSPRTPSRTYHPTFLSQVYAMLYRKLSFSLRDYYTVPLLLAPCAAAILAADLYATQFITPDESTSNLITVGIYMAGYFCAPGWIGTFIVYERTETLKNSLLMQGCDLRAYWLGTFLADYLLLSVPMVVTWITWGAAGMSDFYSGPHAVSFLFYLLFNAQMILFAYTCALFFRKPRSPVLFMPILVIILFLLPVVVWLISVEFSLAFGTSMSDGTSATILLWGIMLASPHGAIFTGYLNIAYDYQRYLYDIPPLGWVLFFQLFEAAGYAVFIYSHDTMMLGPVTVRAPKDDPRYDPQCLEMLDEDVREERVRTLSRTFPDIPSDTSSDIRSDHSPTPDVQGCPTDVQECPALSVQCLRKVFPPKRVGHTTSVALEDMAFQVHRGEIFGLLGLNSAGKTTALSVLSRAVLPTAGEARICGHSVLTSFPAASKHCGVVTQRDALWQLLTVDQHLVTFGHLRGIPGNILPVCITDILSVLDLLPYRYVLVKHLTGGRKRALSVALALLGDPEVLLLDAPSAGLDPVSRRNVWAVLRRAMHTRAVLLTTHSMDEAEALCTRIGIMVRGQLRALGTTTHLKHKFGSGFELTVKCRRMSEKVSEKVSENVGKVSEKVSGKVSEKVSENMSEAVWDRQVEQVTRFVHSLFPAAVRMDGYGGTIIYEIPKHEMQMGKAFTYLEQDKERLQIEDYTIAQPTLEQIFLRTVNRYEQKVRETLAGLGHYDDRMSDHSLPLPPSPPSHIPDEVYFEMNQCGCTNYFMKTLIIVFAFLTLIFIAADYSARHDQHLQAGLFTMGILCMAASVFSCHVLYCPCCQSNKGHNE